MINNEVFLLIAIDSTHIVMQTEKILLKNNFNIKIIPLPSEIKSSCGLSIKGDINDVQSIFNCLKTNNLNISLIKFYRGEKSGFKKSFSIIDL